MLLLLGLEAERLDLRLVSMYTSLHGDGTNYTEYLGLRRRIGSDGVVSDWTRTREIHTKSEFSPSVYGTHHTLVSALSVGLGSRKFRDFQDWQELVIGN